MHNITSLTIIAEYIWIGGKGELRSKSRVVRVSKDIISAKDIPDWDFDGSSTQQAQTDNSEIILKPCALYIDPFRQENCFIVLCSTFLPDGNPTANNHRFKTEQLLKDCDIIDINYDNENNKGELVYGVNPWFAFEQEYFIFCNDTNLPLGFNSDGKQGQYYCSVGKKNALGRNLVEDHFKKCLEAGLGITGVNAEVAVAQWEFQILGKGINAADKLIVARYILERLSEDYNVYIVWHPKPLRTGEWNGSGLHTNFSTKTMRDSYNLNKDLTEINEAIDKLEAAHEKHMAVYGEENELRLTGEFETSSFSYFKRGQNNGDRSASVRVRNGYLEDRRPASNADPYLVSAAIYETIIKKTL